MFYRVASPRSRLARLKAAAVLAGSLAVLALSAYLQPDARGLGTHEQLHLAPCTLVMLTGYPCPTCGMTTAFAHTVRGQLVAAFWANPAGLIFAIGTIAAGAVSLSVVFTGKVWAVNWYRISPSKLAIVAILIVVGGWMFKLIAGVAAGTLPLK
ncbi:MAG: DUF2752 domain-containing protein [Planctomycetes bacterium]|nr:DUF2752 domain-containing protein [Planctomycetota bacterium]